MLVNGVWEENFHPYQSANKDGGFVRLNASIRNEIESSGEEGSDSSRKYFAEKNRYHLYVSLTCPWACRTLIIRRLKKLESLISVSVVEPFLTDKGWGFGNYPGSDLEALYGSAYVHELYTRSDPNYSGRATVPILWDKKYGVIVNNESADIIRMFNSAFNRLAPNSVDLRPKEYLGAMNEFNQIVYEKLNNAVYRCGFAKTQSAYESAMADVFSTLEYLDERLNGQAYVFGDRITESDVRLFVTLIRFDIAYFGLFKCNLARIVEYQNLHAYMLRLYQRSEVCETVNIDHIKQGYYSIKALNPTGVVPLGPRRIFGLNSVECPG